MGSEGSSLGLQVDLLCRDKTNKRIRGLVPPPQCNVSLQYAEKGSYRQAHIISYLGRWLEHWTPERQTAGDWRILYMDVAKSHVADDVVQFAHGRGYATLFHYGCTTGVAQINDTDLHGELEDKYIELEQIAFHTQQLMDPGNIARTLQNVLDDLCGAWRSCDHQQGLRGHKKVGLNNALDGSEDGLITREARVFWHEADMSNARTTALAEVDALVDSGEISVFSDWQKLIRHPEDPGVVEDEGAELESDLDDDECPWEGDDALAEGSADDLAVLLADEASCQAVVEASPGDAPADVADAVVAAKRLLSLKRIRSAAMADNVPAAAFHVEREVNQLERGLRAGGRPDEKRVNEVLRRHMDNIFREEADRIKKAQTESLQRRCEMAKVKASLAKRKAVKDKAALEKRQLQAKLDELPTEITSKQCGRLGAAGAKVRANALERIKLRSPKLTFAKEARWVKLREAFAEHVPLRFKFHGGDRALGVDFVKQVNTLMENLGTSYAGNSQFNKPGMKGGDKTAFDKFFDQMELALPAGGVKAVI